MGEKSMENIICKCCGGKAVKNGRSSSGIQRYLCVSCRRTFAIESLRYSDEEKAQAMEYYLNNCGIRKTALFVKCSPGTIINWIREATFAIPNNQAFALNSKHTDNTVKDIVEMDEIYTFCLKKPTK